MLQNDEHYQIAHSSLANVDFVGVEISKEVLTAKNKTINRLTEQSFLPTPLTVVELDLFYNDAITGFYKIYIKDDNTIIDDVLKFY